MKNKHSFLSKALTLCVAIAMLLAVAAPAMAATNTPATVAANSVSMTKRLTTRSQDVTIPNATFTFTVAAGTAADATADTPQILAGITAGTAGTDDFRPKVANAEFTPADTYTGINTYVDKTLNIDFGTIAFPNPGVYRYVITETAPNPAIAGVTTDAAPRYLDVYVQDTDENGKLGILGTVLHKNETGAIGTAPSDNKDGGFFNSYVTGDLVLSKTVAGNQGDRTKLFQFTVTISGVTAGNQFVVKPTAGSTTLNAAPTGKTPASASPLTATGGTATSTFYLKHGDAITIYGLPKGATYSVTEESLTAEGYTTEYKINDVATATTGSATGNQTTVKDDADTVAFTNTRKGTVPTGILLDVAPYALIVAIAGMALIMLLGKCKAATR